MTCKKCEQITAFQMEEFSRRGLPSPNHISKRRLVTERELAEYHRRFHYRGRKVSPKIGESSSASHIRETPRISAIERELVN